MTFAGRVDEPSFDCAVFLHSGDEPVTRILLFGASNLTLAFPHLLASLRRAFDDELLVFAAHGHGRSYGTWSRVLFRSLPGITTCRLWNDLDQVASHADQTYALVTDVGNDILYGRHPDEISHWVESVLQRLQARNAKSVLTLLPLCSIRRLSVWRYTIMRLCLFPASRLDFENLVDCAELLNQKLEELGTKYGATLVQPNPEWYGFDPIHVAPTLSSRGVGANSIGVEQHGERISNGSGGCA